MIHLSRRDFLKFTSMLPLGLALSSLSSSDYPLNSAQSASLPNVLIVLFDAMTAKDLSVYGYRRETTPNLARFAEHATVYHSHNSAGSFTISGTASLLTGLYPWTHRALNQGGLMERSLAKNNIFNLIGSRYTRVAFSQNIWSDFILSQFQDDIDIYLSPATASVTDHIIGAHFKDRNLAMRAFDDFLLKEDPPASIVFNPIKRVLFEREKALASSNDYPKGLPESMDYPLTYRLDSLFEGLTTEISGLKNPFFAYFHIFSPHSPYSPSSEFYGKFDDNWRPKPKPAHHLGAGIQNSELNDSRRSYDEYIATVDKEFGRFMDNMEKLGVTKNTYIIVTADHGEMFERGEKGHVTPLLFDPVIHIPLLISAPGQTNSIDIQTSTNSVDVVPTLLHLTGQEIPAQCQGQILPGLGGSVDPDRSTFSMEGKRNVAFGPMWIGTFAIRKGQYKLVYYRGYEAADSFELYDTENDPEELIDIYATNPVEADSLREELLGALSKFDKKPSR